MRNYETMFIIKPTLTPEEIQVQVENVKNILTKNGSEIVYVDEWGTRNLAYAIQKHKRGFYCIIYFKADPSAIPEIERLYNINENILRFIFVKYESRRELKAWTGMVEKAQKKAAIAAEAAAPKAEAPKAEAPKVEAPKTEAPADTKPEAPSSAPEAEKANSAAE